MNECGATEAEATGDESNHSRNHSSAKGRDLSRGFLLFAGVLSYKVTKNAGFVGIEPLLVGETQGSGPASLWSHFCQRMCLYVFAVCVSI